MVFIFEIIIDISKNFDYFVVIIIEFSEHNRKAVNYRFENLDGFWHWIHSKIHRVFRIFYLINRSLRFMIHFDIFENSKKFFGFPLALCLTAYENRFLRIGATSANCFGCLFWTFVSSRSKNWSSDRERLDGQALLSSKGLLKSILKISSSENLRLSKFSKKIL